MNNLNKETVLQQLKWRYATKKFDPTRTIADADWAALEEALILSPSSFGLQPWRFVVVSDPELRAKLVPHSWGQTQVADASRLVVFAIKKNMGVADVDRFVARIAQVRGTTVDSLQGYRDIMAGFLSRPKDQFDVDAWSIRQVYIALGNFMTTAAMLGIDTCPMEGLDPAKYDEILGLDALGLKTVCACPVGYRAADDKYATTPKVRFESKDLFVRL